MKKWARPALLTIAAIVVMVVVSVVVSEWRLSDVEEQLAQLSALTQI